MNRLKQQQPFPLARGVIMLLLLASSLSPAKGDPLPQLLKNHRQQAEHLLTKLAQGKKLQVTWAADQATPRLIRGLALSLPGESNTARARHFLDKYSTLFVSPADTLELLGQQSTRTRQVFRFAQRHRGIPVEGALVTLSFDRADRLRLLTSSAKPVLLESLTATISRQHAIQTAQDQALTQGRSSRTVWRKSWAKLIILAEGGPARLVWRVVLPLHQDLQGRIFLVDASSGNYLGWRRGVISEDFAARSRRSQP